MCLKLFDTRITLMLVTFSVYERHLLIEQSQDMKWIQILLQFA